MRTETTTRTISRNIGKGSGMYPPQQKSQALRDIVIKPPIVRKMHVPIVRP